MMQRCWRLAALGLLSLGCASQAQSTPRLASRQVESMRNGQTDQDHSRCDATRPGRNASEYDTNGDGVPDVRKVYQTVGEGSAIRAVLVCREVDLNHDGRKDVFRFYNDEGRTLREEEDHNFDGRIDVITYFDAGQVVRREMDTNGDGMVDMRVFYRETASSENARTLGAGGGSTGSSTRARDVRPFRAERELQNDNNPEFRADYWEFYDAQGRVVRIGWDYDRDGRADRWDRVDRVAPVRQQASGSAANTAPASADPTLTPTPAAADPTLTPTPPPGTPGTPATPGAPATPAPATPAPAPATP